MTTDTAAPRPRHRSAEDTAAALLDAAATRFSRDGYDAVSVRDIAADVGVNPALIYRYFGSKEKLFVAVVSRDRDPAAIIEGPLRELPDRAVTWFHNRPASVGGEHPLGLMLRTSGREGVASLMRAQVQDTVARLAERLDGPEAELRAALILAVNIGMGVLTTVADVDALISAPPERLRAHLAAAVDPLLEPLLEPLPETLPGPLPQRRGEPAAEPSRDA
ncbi:TetR/AcrR family transcriptional regulator [Yinghuangia seranimata]|uniref:TetR/AcrR family transcriptional regulator n=1 Tax=Yinghuangia seranimata TaxID=408067 RepID=UPI00248BAB5A|nr:TetR/AcrR family transcriptional regulator [Yinghuangia seranimata]MDI2132725.1 TetR family transcriptional regulator [Yinghuangia seranimata]